MIEQLKNWLRRQIRVLDRMPVHTEKSLARKLAYLQAYKKTVQHIELLEEATINLPDGFPDMGEDERYRVDKLEREEARQALIDWGYDPVEGEGNLGVEHFRHNETGESATLYPSGRINDIELDGWLKMKVRQRGM